MNSIQLANNLLNASALKFGSSKSETIFSIIYIYIYIDVEVHEFNCPTVCSNLNVVESKPIGTALCRMATPQGKESHESLGYILAESQVSPSHLGG